MAAEKKKILQEILPPDLIILILSMLPAKSLLKFKCVSKEWYNWVSDPCIIGGERLIKNPIFVYVNDHLAYRWKLHFTVTDSEGENLYEFKGDKKFFSKDHRITCMYSCNGLICFDIQRSFRSHFENIYVCNPITRELILLPRRCHTDFPRQEGALFIAFGFGYLPSLQEYRVVRLYLDSELKHINCEVLILTCRKVWGRDWHSQWRTVSANCPRRDSNPHRVPTLREAVFANGCLYWLAYSYSKFKSEYIASFNLSSNEFRILPAPPVVGIYLDVISFGGFFSLVDRNYSTWKIWSLQDQDECHWTNTHTIDMSDYIGTNSTMFVKGAVSDQVLLMIRYKLVTGTASPPIRNHIYYNTEIKECRSIEVPIVGRYLAVVHDTAECLAKICL